MYVQPSKHGLATLNCPLNLTSGLTKKKKNVKVFIYVSPTMFLKELKT